MAAKNPGQRRSEYYARIGRIGGKTTKRKHGQRRQLVPPRRKKS